MTHAVSISQHPHCLAIRPDGHLHPMVVQRALPDRRPYLHPLRSADGEVELTEDMPVHHPWQHGIAIGLNAINGLGFWTEGLATGHHDGVITCDALSDACALADGEAVLWSTRASYRRPDAQPLLEEVQQWQWRMAPDRASYHLDLTWDLHGLVDIQAERYPYGGLFVRMPYAPGVAAVLLTSSGIQHQALADAQPAQWVALALCARASGRWHGLAVIDHPDNPGHPQSWRVDTDLGFGPGRCIKGAWRLAAGSSCRSRYRCVAFPGRPSAAMLDDHAASFAASGTALLGRSAALVGGQS